MPDELILFEKMQRGDTSALEYFFREYTDVLYYRALGFVKDNLAGGGRYRAGGIHSFLAITEKSENNGFCSRLFVQGSGPSLPQLSRAFESETSLRGKSEMGRGDGGGFGG